MAKNNSDVSVHKKYQKLDYDQLSINWVHKINSVIVSSCNGTKSYCGQQQQFIGTLYTRGLDISIPLQFIMHKTVKISVSKRTECAGQILAARKLCVIPIYTNRNEPLSTLHLWSSLSYRAELFRGSLDYQKTAILQIGKFKLLRVPIFRQKKKNRLRVKQIKLFVLYCRGLIL